MKWLVSALAVCVLVPSALCASGTTDWCYHETSCGYTNWPTIAPNYCNGSRQSPIDIVPADAQADSNLKAFVFTNYNTTGFLDKTKNTGRTAKVTLKSGVRIEGGGLSEPYDSLQFHLHWGNLSTVGGAEHTVNGKRYPMELHIVNAKSSFNGNTTLAIADSTGLAALGFFIEEMSGNDTGKPAAWATLAGQLSSIPYSGNSVNAPSGISLNDLIGNVNTASYYRYLGSLTTPNCNEAVVWTVFKDTIKVSKDVIDLFSTTLHVSNSSSPIMVNVYRGIQKSQKVTTQASSASSTCYSLGLMALSVILGRS